MTADKPVANMAEHSPKLAGALKVLVRKLEAMPEPLRGPFLVEGLAPYSQSELSRLSAENDELRKERDEAVKWYLDAIDQRDQYARDASSLQARLSEAVEVLKPFARAANSYDPDEDDGDMDAWDYHPTIGELRRARTFINSFKGDTK